MKWSYGITTVPSRVNDLFPKTLASLAKAGFDKSRIFVDGCHNPVYYSQFNLEVTSRYPAIRTYGNWLLTLLELYIREPLSDRYAIFQDDFVTYNNLRQYLERCELPEKGYWNLNTFPPTHQLPPPERVGWYPSNQRGRGAVGLVFNRLGVVTLLTSQHMMERPQSVTDKDVTNFAIVDRSLEKPQEVWYKGQKNVDGAICTSFEKSSTAVDRWTEYIHNPSLIKHTGQDSTMQNRRYPEAASFRGESFDALEFLPCDSTSKETSEMQSTMLSVP